MPTQPLQSPDHPIALRRSHLLAPAPDRLTNNPTTLSITRENTLSGRDFTVHQLRRDEPPDSPRRNTLLYTVTGKFWSNSQHREIRDAVGRPLLELRRLWWKGQWSVKRAGGEGDDLLNVDMRWAIGTKLSLRFNNALVAGRSHGYLGRRGRHQDETEREAPPPPYTPPPYSAVLAEDHQRRQNSHSQNGTESDSSDASNPKSSSGSGTTSTSTSPPSYDSIRRRSSHSLRDLLDAIEPPREPAPAPLSHQRRWSEGGIDPKVELKLIQQSGTVSVVMMGERKIVYIRRTKVMDYNLSGPMARWEVEIGEGVDLLLVSRFTSYYNCFDTFVCRACVDQRLNQAGN